MTEIKDIYDGKNVTVWEDEDMTYLNIWNTTICFPNEDWKNIKKELKEL